MVGRDITAEPQSARYGVGLRASGRVVAIGVGVADGDREGVSGVGLGTAGEVQ